MGRLMDSVMAAVGLKPSDRVTITHGPLDTKNLKPPQADTVSDKPTEQIAIPDKPTEQPAAAKPSNSTIEQPIGQVTKAVPSEQSSSQVTGQLGQILQENALKDPVKSPVEKKDCFGCRVTGLVIGPAASAFILHSIYTRRHMYTGAVKYAYYAQGLLLSTGLTTLGLCRFFEISIFDPNKADMSLGDHFKDELKSIGISVDTPEGTK